MAVVSTQIDVDEEFINNIDSKLRHLQTQICFCKSEINEKFQEFIISVLKCKGQLLTQMDEILYQAISDANEHKIEIAKTSNNHSKMHKIKLQSKNIPEISLKWNIDALTHQLQEACIVTPSDHPYPYMGKDTVITQKNILLNSPPKSLETDTRNGDVYFLCNSDKDQFDFKIFSADRFGNAKWTRSLERIFYPISLCVGEDHIFVSTSGRSLQTQILQNSPQNLPNELKSKAIDHVLMLDKVGGGIFKRIQMESEQFGPIAFEPKCGRIFLLTKMKGFPFLTVFNSELQIEDKGIELKHNHAGLILSPPKIKKIEIIEDEIIVFADDSSYIDFFNMEGILLSSLTKLPGISTADPWLNILSLDRNTSTIDVLSKTGNLLSKYQTKLESELIDIKFDISTGRILLLTLSSQKLSFVYI